MRDKIGKFTISNLILQDTQAHESIMRLMGRMIVVRCEQRFDANGIEYIAMSNYFKEVSQGQQIPRYIFTFTNDEIKCEAL